MAKTPAQDKKPIKEPRRVNTGKYRSFRLQKKITTGERHLPGSFTLLKGSFGVLKKRWKTVLGIVLIYGFLNAVLVQSFSGNDLEQTKTVLDGSSDGSWGQITSALTLFIYLAASSGNLNSEVAGAYQLMLTVMTSLALIWTLRQIYADKATSVREAFYRGMHPLVPFVLVVLVGTLQLIPIVTGGFLFNLVTGNGIAGTGVENVLWGIVFFLLALLTLFMLSATIMAIYIVCLPEMTPMVALRSAADLVRYRRWEVMRKLLILPVFLLITSMLLILPLIYVSAPLAGFMFFVTSMVGLPVIHSYLYRVYRELL
jgi:hypothetical protein